MQVVTGIHLGGLAKGNWKTSVCWFCLCSILVALNVGESTNIISTKKQCEGGKRSGTWSSVKLGKWGISWWWWWRGMLPAIELTLWPVYWSLKGVPKSVNCSTHKVKEINSLCKVCSVPSLSSLSSLSLSSNLPSQRMEKAPKSNEHH